MAGDLEHPTVDAAKRVLHLAAVRSDFIQFIEESPDNAAIMIIRRSAEGRVDFRYSQNWAQEVIHYVLRLVSAAVTGL